ncbi:hypothetical protein HY410_00925 [Candidatus Gottesmanbacteria bacterium]|nr:hypothetical protein [Candidatus Gottesmanbacteria bacterium]
MKMRLELRWYIFVTVVSLLVLWPLLRSGFYVSDDGEWMVIRLSAFYQSLAEGQFPVRFLGRLNNSYGYPVANFLYPGFLYIGSLLHFLGLSFVNSIKIILGASVVGAALFLFASLRRSFSPLSSFIGVFSFLTAPYLAFDLYKRGSVGEILALLGAAMAIWSLEAGYVLVFPLAIALGVVSHNSLALLFTIFFCVYLLVARRFNWFIHVAIGLGLSAFFWIPAIVERHLVKFSSLRISNPRQYFVTLQNIDDLGLLFIAASIVYLVMRVHRSSSWGRGIYTGGFFVGLFLASPWSEMIWNNPVFARLFQFPFRMLAIVLLCGPWLIAHSVEHLRSVRGKLVGLYIVLGLLSLVPILTSINFVDRPEGYYATNEGTTTVADEYMPKWVRSNVTERNSNRIEIFQGRGTIVPRLVNTQSVDATLILEADSIIGVNTIYYPGWGVTIDDHPTSVDYKNDRGLMRVNVPRGTHHLVAEFRETPLRFVADSVSVASFIIYVLVIAKSVFVKRQRS